MDAFGLLSPPPGFAAHWLGLRGGRASGGTTTDPDLLHRLVETAPEFNLYLGLNLTSTTVRVRPRAPDITHITHILLDIDPFEPSAHPLRFAEVLHRHAENLLGIRLDPHLIDTGRGAQLWLPSLPTPLSDALSRRLWQHRTSLFLRALAASLNGRFGCNLDTSTADAPRVGRLIGSVNQKTGRRATLLTEGVRSSDLLPALSRFTESLPPVAHRTTHRATVPSSWQHAIDLLPFAIPRIFLTEGAAEPGRHSAAFAAAASLREVGVPLEGALEAVRFGAGLCSPELPRAHAERAARCAYARQEAMDGYQGGTRCY